MEKEFKIDTVSDLQYANPEHTKVNLNVKFKDSEEVFPFTTDTDDLELHGIELHVNAMTGKYGPVGSYTPDIVDPELQLRRDLKTIGLSDDMENIMDAMLLFDQAMFDAISEETLDKYRMKKTLKNQ